MIAIGWFFAGAAGGALYGLLLWWTVAALHPTDTRGALILVWGGALLRVTTMAVLLTVAVDQSLRAGLCALAGFLLARLSWSEAVAFRLADACRD